MSDQKNLSNTSEFRRQRISANFFRDSTATNKSSRKECQYYKAFINERKQIKHLKYLTGNIENVILY